ncbi:MAG: hypothetical protein DMG21_19030, partial [Acidobacteria bacterium]
CNERCVHCYLEHDDRGEMTTAEICGLLDQLAEAGVFFLTFSGGEVLMRMDFFEILEHARARLFSVKIKTNAFMIREKQADRMRDLGVDSVQVSIYSHRAEVHDAITKLPGSLKRSLAGIRSLRERGLKVIIANVLMRQNVGDYAGVQALARELGVKFTMAPTVTPKMDGDRSLLELGIGGDDLRSVFRNPDLVGNVEEFCAPPPAATGEILDEVPVPAAQRQRPKTKIPGDLAALLATERGALDSPPRSAGLLDLRARWVLHALSRAGLYARKYAWPQLSGLREILRPHRNPFRQHARPEVLCRNLPPCADCRFGALAGTLRSTSRIRSLVSRRSRLIHRSTSSWFWSALLEACRKQFSPEKLEQR